MTQDPDRCQLCEARIEGSRFYAPTRRDQYGEVHRVVRRKISTAAGFCFECADMLAQDECLHTLVLRRCSKCNKTFPHRPNETSISPTTVLGRPRIHAPRIIRYEKPGRPRTKPPKPEKPRCQTCGQTLKAPRNITMDAYYDKHRPQDIKVPELREPEQAHLAEPEPKPALPEVHGAAIFQTPEPRPEERDVSKSEP